MGTLAHDPGSDGAPQKQQKQAASQRRCIVTGVSSNKENLIRFVIDPQHLVVPDIEQRLPGRGIWLSADRETLKKACAKNIFAKAAREGVTVPVDLVEQVEGRLVRQCLNLIGIARRAGQAVFGYEKVRDWFRSGRTGCLFVAADASENAQVKAHSLAGDKRVVAPLTADELGTLLGGGRTAVYVVCAHGPLEARLRRETTRLAGIRGIAADDDDKCKSPRTTTRVLSQT